MSYTCCTLVHFVPIENPDIVIATVDHMLSCYIPWGFTSHLELCYYEDIHVYLGLEDLVIILVDFGGVQWIGQHS